MATPLGELLRQLRTDTDTHGSFHRSPAEYLHEHGWGDLDAADVQEALFLLADAAPATEAAAWVATGEAIDVTAPDAALALDTALAGDDGPAAPDDPEDLDRDDDRDGDPSELDGDPSELDRLDDDLAPDGQLDDPLDVGAAFSAGAGAVDPTPAAAHDTDGPATDGPATDGEGRDDPFDPADDPFAPSDAGDTPSLIDGADAPDTGHEPEPDWDDPT